MSGQTDVVDIDVSGDGPYEGLTLAFEDEEVTGDSPFMSPDNDQDRIFCMEDIFEDSGDTVTRWRSSPKTVVKININGAESRMLDSMKRIIQPMMMSSSRLVQKPIDCMLPVDFASKYVNRDWYLLLLDYINSENAGKWPYCTNGNPKEWQIPVPLAALRRF
jgi:hypothetical protein